MIEKKQIFKVLKNSFVLILAFNILCNGIFFINHQNVAKAITNNSECSYASAPQCNGICHRTNEVCNPTGGQSCACKCGNNPSCNICQRCDGIQCVLRAGSECASNADCVGNPNGRICDGNCSCGCEQDSDCPNPREDCIMGVCVDDTTVLSCASSLSCNGSCPEGQTCVNNAGSCECQQPQQLPECDDTVAPACNGSCENEGETCFYCPDLNLCRCVEEDSLYDDRGNYTPPTRCGPSNPSPTPTFNSPSSKITPTTDNLIVE